MYCPNCGRPVDTPFCPNCGAKLEFDLSDLANEVLDD